MIHDRKTSVTAWLAMAALLAVGACAEKPPETSDDDLSVSDPSGGSIIRADAEIETEEPPMEPLQMTIPFDGMTEDDDTLPPATASAIDELLESEQVRAGGEITLRSHTSSDGSDAEALELSRTNAERVSERLIEAGVSEDRIEVIAFGEQNPVEPNALPDGSPNEEGRAANRRIKVHVSVPDDGDAMPVARPTAQPQPATGER